MPLINDVVAEVNEQLTASLDWYADNYYGELAEIYRNLKCRTVAITDEKGNEIKDRTNVCLPDHAVMVRRGTARLTQNPPNLKVRGGESQEQRDKVSHVLMFQWDRSRQQRVFRQVVHQAKAFGWSVDKTYWDSVRVVRKLRRYTEKISREELLGLLRQSGMPEEEIGQRVGLQGPEQLSEGELMFAMSEFGDEVSLGVPTLKYEGPVGERIFIGDIFPEPGFQSLHKSAYVIEEGFWDENRLRYWTKQKTTNPETGEETPVFDEAQVEELLKAGGRSKDSSASGKRRLREQLRESIKQTEPQVEPRLTGPRFSVRERHQFTKGGHYRVDWVGEEKVHLGTWWCPFDTYGRYIYNELVLWPDLLGGIGDSVTRVTRFLMQLRNTRANQTTDFINNKLRPGFTERDTADITAESFVRYAWGWTLRVKDHSDLQPFQDHPFPAEAFSDQAQYVREMQQVDGNAADFASGTPTVPQAGKLATSLLLQQKATDVVTADELRQVDEYLRDVLELRLAMTQQMMQEPVDIETGAKVEETIEAVSIRNEGQPAVIKVDPMEIQEDFEIMPETGSTLAQDDEFKRAAREKFYTLAMSNPALFNIRRAAELLVETIPGLSKEEALNPPPDPNKPPSLFAKGISATLSMKPQDLPADVLEELLGRAKLPTAGLKAKRLLELPKKVAEAAEAIDELNQPVTVGAENEDEEGERE